MNYLFYGTETYLINKEISKIKEENNIDDFSTINYDFDNTNILDILEDANTVPLFSEKKLIICNNASIFCSQSKKGISDNEIDKLIDYIEHPNNSTILIFQTDNIDGKRKSVTRMKKNGIVKEFNKTNNVVPIVKEMFQGYKIDNSTINLLINRVGKNISILKQEIDKLKNYKYDEKVITDNDILMCTEEKIDGDVFNLIDCITARDINKSLSIYNELLKYNESPVKILTLLANYYRTLYQAKSLINKGHTEKEVATILEANPYYINQVIKKGKNIPIDKTLEYLSKLSDLDYNIKTNRVDQVSGLELFIIEA